MKKFLLNLYFWPVFIFITLVGLVLLPFILLVNFIYCRRSVASGLRRAIRVYGWYLVRLVPFFAPIKVEYDCGEIPTPAIFVANHNSAIDPYLFGAIAVENGFVTSWPFRIPVYNILMRYAGYANTDDGWDEVKKKSRDMFSQGSCVTIWPEGHRSRDGKVGRFKNGAFSLAMETGVPIIPVCILGSGEVMAPGNRLLSPARVKLIVLEAVYPDTERNDPEGVMELRCRVRSMIEQRLDDSGHFNRPSSARSGQYAGGWTKSILS